MLLTVLLFIIGILLIFIAIASIVAKILLKKEENTTSDVISVSSSYASGLEKGLVKRIKCPVVGLNYHNRKGKIKEFVDLYRKKDMFRYDKYEGLTNREIIDEYFNDRIYELSCERLEGVFLEREDDNEYDSKALKVCVNDSAGRMHHIGYVPREHCAIIRELDDRHRMLVANTITGGKYKVVEQDEYGNDKVSIHESDYGLSLSVSFWIDE